MMNKLRGMIAVILAWGVLSGTALAIAPIDQGAYQKRLGELMLESGIMQGTDDSGSLELEREITRAEEFSPIINERDSFFYLTSSRQKTYVKVDEEGTEAAAVTMHGGGGGSAAPVRMTLDHPFSYIIRDDATGNILFVGQINTMNP